MKVTDRRAARAILLTDACEVLLMRMAFPWLRDDLWIVPGGGIETGESPREAVLREVWEETGATDVELLGGLWHREFLLEATATRMHEQYFLVRTPRFEPEKTALLGDEGDWLQEFRWWSLDALRRDPDLRVAPERLLHGLETYLEQGLPAVPFDISDR